MGKSQISGWTGAVHNTHMTEAVMEDSINKKIIAHQLDSDRSNEQNLWLAWLCSCYGCPGSVVDAVMVIIGQLISMNRNR